MTIGEPVPTGEHQEYITARNEYRTYVESDPALQPWYEFLKTATELHKKGDTIGLQKRGDQIANALRQMYKEPRILLPQVQWVQDAGVHRVTGHDFSLPVMVFDKNFLYMYDYLHDGINQGISTQINAELLGLPAGTRAVSLVSVPAQEFDYAFPMPYEQRRRHELIHAVDPNVNRRTGLERLIQTELTATIGEITETDFDDFCRVNISPDFLLAYLKKSAPQYATADIAKRLADYAYKLTSQKYPKTGKRSNADIVRDLMLTTENRELRDIIAPPTLQPKFKITRL